MPHDAAKLDLDRRRLLKQAGLLTAGLTVTASKQKRIAARLVIWPTWRPIWATSSMSPLPSEYHGSMQQSWPKEALRP